MSILILLVGLVGGLALLIEIALLVFRDTLNGGQQIETLKEAIRKTQSELRAADKKLDALRTNRRGAVKELEAGMAKLEELDQESRRAPDKPPVLVYVVGQPGAFGRRFRAKITKKPPASSEIDENQTLLWRHESVVEIISDNPDTARRDMLRQFAEPNGYSVGPVTEVQENTGAAA